MRHEQLKNHIKGSFLKEEYLEAFLVQSAYIESFLKIYADFNSWKSCGGEKMDDDPILVTLYKQIQRYNLNELIDFLHKSKLISDEQKNLLNYYREKRNKVLHDLIQEISKETFERELQEACVVGNKIIDGEEFKKIHSLINFVEEEDKKAGNAIKKELPSISSEKNQNNPDRDGSVG
jgi:hypothetical protein